MEGNALPSHVLYWGSKNGTFRHWEEFPSEPEAMKGLARRTASAPWHTYRIARILGSLPATADEPRAAVSGPKVALLRADAGWATGSGGSLGE